MARTKRTDRERTLERETLVWEMRLRLMSHEKIAEELTQIERKRNPDTKPIDRTTITKMLDRISKRKDAEMDRLVSVMRHEHTAMLEKMAHEAMEAFYASKQPAKDAQKLNQTGRGTTEKSRVQTQNADPRFLTEARSTLKDIREIWGAKAPDQTEITGKLSVGRELTDEELEAIARRSGGRASEAQTVKEKSS